MPSRPLPSSRPISGRGLAIFRDTGTHPPANCSWTCNGTCGVGPGFTPRSPSPNRSRHRSAACRPKAPILDPRRCSPTRFLCFLAVERATLNDRGHSVRRMLLEVPVLSSIRLASQAICVLGMSFSFLPKLFRLCAVAPIWFQRVDRVLPKLRVPVSDLFRDVSLLAFLPLPAAHTASSRLSAAFGGHRFYDRR